MHITRRAGLLGATALAACSSGTPGGSPVNTAAIATAEQDGLTLDQSLIRIIGLIEASPATPANVKAEGAALTNGVNEPLDIAAATLTALIAGAPPPTNAPTGVQIAGYFNTALNVIEPIVATVDPTAALAVESAQVLLLAYEAVVGTPAPATPAAAAAHAVRLARARSSTISREQARANLLGFNRS